MTTQHQDEPQFAALHAQCRAVGVDLMRAKNWQGEPIYLVGRWGMFRELMTLQAVANWLEATGQGRAK